MATLYPFELLLRGQIWDSFVYTYSGLIGEPLFIMILLSILFGVTYIKTGSFQIIALQIVLAGAFIIPMVPAQAQIYLAFLAVIGISIGIYDFFRSWK